jgi:hypothetical protein
METGTDPLGHALVPDGACCTDPSEGPWAS